MNYALDTHCTEVYTTGMAKKLTRTVYLHQCKRCGDEWESQSAHPLRCGKCKSPYWNIERAAYAPK